MTAQQTRKYQNSKINEINDSTPEIVFFYKKVKNHIDSGKITNSITYSTDLLTEKDILHL
jgi:hypothetical protein